MAAGGYWDYELGHARCAWLASWNSYVSPESIPKDVLLFGSGFAIRLALNGGDVALDDLLAALALAYGVGGVGVAVIVTLVWNLVMLPYKQWLSDQVTITSLRSDLTDKRKFEYLANECKKHIGDAQHHMRNRPVTDDTFNQWWSIGAEIAGRCGKKYHDSWDTAFVGKGVIHFSDRHDDLQAYATKLRSMMDDMNAKAESKEIQEGK